MTAVALVAAGVCVVACFGIFGNALGYHQAAFSLGRQRYAKRCGAKRCGAWIAAVTMIMSSIVALS